MPPVLGYWDIRGLAGVLRCVLHYTGTEFEDKRYAYASSPTEQTEWRRVKHTLGLAFPTLPYYIDGDTKLSQSQAILKHLARKHGLTPGNTEEELCRADMAVQQMIDILLEFVRVCCNEKFDTEKEVYIKALPGKLEPFSKLLGTEPWLMGDKLTYVDFMFHEMLDDLKFLAPDVVNSFDNLKAFMQRFEALPRIQKYRKSKHFTSWPLVGPTAIWGGSGDPPTV